MKDEYVFLRDILIERHIKNTENYEVYSVSVIKESSIREIILADLLLQRRPYITMLSTMVILFIPRAQLEIFHMAL